MYLDSDVSSNWIEFSYLSPTVVDDATSMEDGMAACYDDYSCKFIVGTLTGGVTTVTYYTDWWDLYDDYYIVGENYETEAVTNTDDEWQWIYLKTDDEPEDDDTWDWDDYDPSVWDYDEEEPEPDTASYITMGFTAAAACVAALI